LPPIDETKLPPIDETKLPPIDETKLPTIDETKEILSVSESEIAMNSTKDAFLLAYKDYLQGRKKREKLGISQKDDNLPDDLKDLKREYRDAKISYMQARYAEKKEEIFKTMPDMKDKDADTIKRSDIIAAGKINDRMKAGYFDSKIFNEVELSQQEDLQKARKEALGIKEKNTFSKGLEWYNKRSRASKIAILTAVITGAFLGSGVLTGATAGIYASQRIVRSVVGVFFGTVASKATQHISEKMLEERKKNISLEFEKEFDVTILAKMEAKRSDDLERIESFKKKAFRVKVALAIATSMAAGFGSGALMATDSISTDQEIKKDTTLPQKETPMTSEELSKSLDDLPILVDLSINHSNLTPEYVLEQEPQLAEKSESVIYNAKSGDNLWKIIGKMDELKGLEGGQKSNAIANIIEAIKKDPETLKALGFDSPKDLDNLKVGQEMDLGKIKDILNTVEIKNEHIVEHAQHLDKATIDNIEANEAKMAELKSVNIGSNVPGVANVISAESPIAETIPNEKISTESIKHMVAEGNVKDIVGKYNTELFTNVTGEINKNGDAVINFGVKDNALDVKMIITNGNRMAIDGHGLNNWPDGVKLGSLFFSRNLDTFAELNEENMKMALEFINKGKAIVEHAEGY
ncbi:MAG: hypothetical protein AAB614_03355, partial [Patescibacteria group bacterium]